MCYPQLKTSSNDRSYIQNERSPTTNWKTHDLWASYHINSLDKLHETSKPTHFLTLKFNQLETAKSINKLLDSLNRTICNFNANNDHEISLYGILNADKSGVIHYHLICRTDFVDFHNLLIKKINKYNKKYGTKADINYCEQIVDIKEVIRYPFKLGLRNKPIFVKGTGLRFIFSHGLYFEGKRRKELGQVQYDHWKNSLESVEWTEKKQFEEIIDKEQLAETVVQSVEDWHEWTYEILADNQERSIEDNQENSTVDPISQASYEEEKERKRVQGLKRKERKQGNHHQNSPIDPKQLE